MVYAHRVVGGDRTVDEGVVFFGVVVAREVAVDEGLAVGVGDVPTIEPLFLGFDEVDFGFGDYGIEGASFDCFWAFDCLRHAV